MERLRISVRSLLDSFRDAVCYFYDPSSGLYSSAAFELEKRELKKRNIKLLDFNKFPLVTGKSKDETFKNSIEKLDENERNLILIHAEDYFNILPEITRFLEERL